jgi:hypothetical protein
VLLAIAAVRSLPVIAVVSFGPRAAPSPPAA